MVVKATQAEMEGMEDLIESQSNGWEGLCDLEVVRVEATHSFVPTHDATLQVLRIAFQ